MKKITRHWLVTCTILRLGADFLLVLHLCLQGTHLCVATRAQQQQTAK